ncbi:hypothetical protein SSCG_02217 [Streptomyces clavuligerus]|nr:hypothetical protein SSCG_02217 [Streptomyces clavuligerus]
MGVRHGAGAGPANLAGDHLADAAEQGIHRINHNPQPRWSYLTQTSLAIHPPHPPNLRKLGKIRSEI